MGQVLPYYGMRLDAVHNGYLGLRQALEGGHDLVLLDVRLPGLDGFELLRQIRRRSHVPIIMLTARGDETDRVTGLDAGADDYLGETLRHRGTRSPASARCFGARDAPRSPSLNGSRPAA